MTPAQCEPLGTILVGRKLAGPSEPEDRGSFDRRGPLGDNQRMCRFSVVGEPAVYEHLRGQGQAITYAQVRQVFEESGWGQLRQELQRRYQVQADNFRPRDGWLVGQLLGQVEMLLAHIETGQGLTREEQVSLTEAQTLAAGVGFTATPPAKALPWLLRHRC